MVLGKIVMRRHHESLLVYILGKALPFGQGADAHGDLNLNIYGKGDDCYQ
jgi:hypothetical protein